LVQNIRLFFCHLVIAAYISSSKLNMNIEEILKDKAIKTKGKVQVLSKAILEGKITIEDLIKVASKAKDADKGTCVETLEFATRTKPEISNQKCLSYAVKCLADEAPRVKWEAAKVIGNIAGLYKTKLDDAIAGLLINTEDPGTVVRWSAAHALSKILAFDTKRNADLIPAIEAIVKREEDNAIKKIYLTGLKKVQKR
jgi:HEAT repeat protein